MAQAYRKTNLILPIKKTSRKHYRAASQKSQNSSSAKAGTTYSENINSESKKKLQTSSENDLYPNTNHIQRLSYTNT